MLYIFGFGATEGVPLSVKSWGCGRSGHLSRKRSLVERIWRWRGGREARRALLQRLDLNERSRKSIKLSKKADLRIELIGSWQTVGHWVPFSPVSVLLALNYNEQSFGLRPRFASEWLEVLIGHLTKQWTQSIRRCELQLAIQPFHGFIKQKLGWSTE